MRQKKIVVCMVSDIVSDYTGGFLKSAIRISKGLDKSRFRVIFFAGKEKFLGKEKDIGGIKVYRFPSLRVPRTKGKVRVALPSSMAINKILKKEGVDIVHIHTPLYLSYLTMKVARKRNLPVIVTSHTQPDNWLLNVPQMNKKFLVEAFYKLFLRMYNKADLIICVSDFGKNLLKKRKIKNKIKVISNGIDLSRFKPRNTLSFDKKFGIDHKKNKLILYVGRLMKEKNIEVLINSMREVTAKLPNARLFIAGEGYKAGSLKRRVKRLRLNSYVKFLGFLPEEELSLAFASCDVFVLPSLIELQGLVLLEAMACGKPIIVANSPNSASPCLVKNNGFLFNPHNSSDLADKIIKVLSDDKLRIKMGKESLKLIKKHNIKFVIREHEKIYRNLLSAKIK
jgi:glycosyltransferase involved in cell wall biosynthesis